MVVGAFPIAKLSVLLIKQISKPIANVCKERAKSNPFFRTYVCMPPAQFYNWCEVKSKMWILNLGKPVNIPVLSQEMAIELGANLLGESVIFIIGAGLLIIEYNRQNKKETAKEAKKQEEYEHLNSTITDLYFTVQRQQTQLREMERMVLSIGGKKPEDSPVLSSTGSPPPRPPTKAPPTTAPKDTTHPAPFSNNPVPNNSLITTTPYPNKGIILSCLNYIQMDAFTSLFPKNMINSNNTMQNDRLDDKVINTQKREPAILSVALYNIENNFRSLF